MSKRSITRREFLGASALAAAGALIAACAPPTPATPAPATPAAVATPVPATPTPAPRFKEAPAFVEQVRAGRLPPLEQRLPTNPVIVKPTEKVGKFGGTWRTALRGAADTAWLVRTIAYENLMRWNPEWTAVIPNIAESVTVSPDGTEFTFKLRRGLKWSNGDPFTADDLVFSFEDVIFNTDLTPSPPAWLMAGGQPSTITKVDDLTVRYKFATPAGLFLQQNCTPGGDGLMRFPQKYLKQFHKKYTPEDKLKPLIEAAKAEDWIKLFRTKGAGIPGTPYDALWATSELPRMHGWMVTTPYTGIGRVAAERNPYYFKVDTEGNQLPYLDRVAYDVIDEVAAIVLKASAGEIDMMDRHIATVANRPVFVENMQRGAFGFFETVPSSMNELAIALNLTCKDLALRAIFQNRDLRIGLSHAINRQELIDVVWVGRGEPWQLSPRPTSPFHNERLAKQYTEFNVQKANEHLDKVLPRKDAEGFRLRPDGKRFTFTVEVTTGQTERIDALGLIQRYWRAVGIDMHYKPMDRALMYARKDANDHEAMVWGGDGGLDVILEPRWYFPFSAESQFAIAWQYWFNEAVGTGAEEPPAAPKKQMELYRQIRATADANRQNELMRQILQIAQEEFYALGIVLPAQGYGIVKNNFKNVPKVMPAAWLYPHPAPTNPSQYFIE